MRLWDLERQNWNHTNIRSFISGSTGFREQIPLFSRPRMTRLSEGGRLDCIPNEVYHIVSPKKSGDYIDYVWFEMVVPGKEMCPYFY